MLLQPDIQLIFYGDLSVLVNFLYYILQHTPLEQLDRKHFAKGSRSSVSNATSNGNNFKDDLKKEIALMEVKMRRLCELLDEVSCSLLPLCAHVRVLEYACMV